MNISITSFKKPFFQKLTLLKRIKIILISQKLAHILIFLLLLFLFILTNQKLLQHLIINFHNFNKRILPTFTPIFNQILQTLQIQLHLHTPRHLIISKQLLNTLQILSKILSKKLLSFLKPRQFLHIQNLSLTQLTPQLNLPNLHNLLLINIFPFLFLSHQNLQPQPLPQP